uniref:Uncharacterized protein n=1 Tax=Arundo donax TaxID=35708 RepID=A0A0A9HJK6_ARUDO
MMTNLIHIPLWLRRKLCCCLPVKEPAVNLEALVPVMMIIKWVLQQKMYKVLVVLMCLKLEAGIKKSS